MKKGLITVFIVLGILVAGLCIWAFAFGEGFNGIYKAFATQVNNIWHGLTGDDNADVFENVSDTEIFGNAQDVNAAAGEAGVDW